MAGDPELSDKIRRTALRAFFDHRRGQAEEAPDPVALLPVMPMNTGQEQAARSALRAPLTVVTGPPGTGKSQVVVDLLASCAHAGKPVLFASKNNKAVDVVRERLRNLLGDQQDWVLRLGNSQTIRKCREDMDGRLAAAGSIPVEQPPSAHLVHEVDEAIANVRRRMQDLVEAQIELAALERDCRSLESLVEEAWVQAGAAGGETESPAEQAVADMLCELGLWHKSQYPLDSYRLDFLVVSPAGTRYDVEVDGRGHLTDEAVRSDAVRDGFVTRQGIKVLRVDARSVFRKPEQVKTLLSRLC